MRDRRWLLSLLLAAAIALAVSPASAQEIGQLGLWAVDAPRLGQRAGIFKKHGLVLDIFGTSGGGETLQAVISGSADLTVGIGTAAVLRAYSKGAPIRGIGGNFAAGWGEIPRGRGPFMGRGGRPPPSSPSGMPATRRPSLTRRADPRAITWS